MERQKITFCYSLPQIDLRYPRRISPRIRPVGQAVAQGHMSGLCNRRTIARNTSHAMVRFKATGEIRKTPINFDASRRIDNPFLSRVLHTEYLYGKACHGSNSGIPGFYGISRAISVRISAIRKSMPDRRTRPSLLPQDGWLLVPFDCPYAPAGSKSSAISEASSNRTLICRETPASCMVTP